VVPAAEKKSPDAMVRLIARVFGVGVETRRDAGKAGELAAIGEGPIEHLADQSGREPGSIELNAARVLICLRWDAAELPP
jgi:hypothetical protein